MLENINTRNLAIVIAIVTTIVLIIGMLSPMYTWRLFFPAAAASLTASIIYEAYVKQFILAV